jgi:hypothetical protein
MTTDPNKATPTNAVPANDSLEAVLAELRQLARQTEPGAAPKAAEPKAATAQSVRTQTPVPRPAPHLRPAHDTSPVAFPPRALPTVARPRYARAGTWVVAGGVTLACAALAIPLRSMIFDPLQEDAEVLVAAEPAAAKVEQRAPVEIASAIDAPAVKETRAAASQEPEGAASSTTASLGASGPVKADPVLPRVEAPPVATSELIKAEAAPAERVVAQPVETASISPIKLPSELRPSAVGSAAVSPALETASAGPLKAPAAAQPPAAAPEGGVPSAVAPQPKPESGPPVAEAAPPKASTPTGAAPPAPAPSVASQGDAAASPASGAASDRNAGGSEPTRMAALGPVPESSATAALVPPAAKPSPETMRMVERARELIRTGDISAARLLLERAMHSGSAKAAFHLAETYDPQMLAQWGTFGIKGDVATARVLYSRALKNGVADSKPRLEALR